MFLQKFLNKRLIGEAFAQLLYVIAIPFYMVELSYMMMIGKSTPKEYIWYMTPLFWGTVWIPGFLSFMINYLLQHFLQEKTPRKWVRNYPSVFILLYSIYFFLLSTLSFGKDCLAAALSGGVLIFFLYLLKKAQKEMFYLPPNKMFWFYVLTFLPPVCILFFTDVYFLIAKESPYFILMAPVSYLPEIFGLFVICFLKKHLFKRKKMRFTLFHAIAIMQVFNIATGIYFGAYWGDKIIWISLTISFATMLIAERCSRFDRS